MKTDGIKTLFDALWEPYYGQNPQVPAIHQLLTGREQSASLYNDHIALRTFQHERVSREVLAQSFTRLGFEARDTFDLPDKHVVATYYRHPSGDWPRVFISELKLDSLSPRGQEIVYELVAQVPQKAIDSNQLCAAGRTWEITHHGYKELLEESEYAAWMAAHGFQMNHATVSVNAMQSFGSLDELVAFLKENGFHLNGEDSGHIIQEAKDETDRVVLRQASTIASQVPVDFLDGRFEVPGCYYEFLQRFHDYDSFDPGNASKIMESTNVKR